MNLSAGRNPGGLSSRLHPPHLPCMTKVHDFQVHVYSEPAQRDLAGEVAAWLPLHRRGLTVFAHPSTGNERSDHVDRVIWFGPGETLATDMFD